MVGPLVLVLEMVNDEVISTSLLGLTNKMVGWDTS
jgi:hypothetical protein